MLEGPGNGAHDEAKLFGRDMEEGTEALLVHSSQQLEKVDSMVGEVLEVVGDHLNRGLEERLQYPRNTRCQ